MGAGVGDAGVVVSASALAAAAALLVAIGNRASDECEEKKDLGKIE